jgi:hypothetical protein
MDQDGHCLPSCHHDLMLIMPYVQYASAIGRGCNEVTLSRSATARTREDDYIS